MPQISLEISLEQHPQLALRLVWHAGSRVGAACFHKGLRLVRDLTEPGNAFDGKRAPRALRD